MASAIRKLERSDQLGDRGDPVALQVGEQAQPNLLGDLRIHVADSANLDGTRSADQEGQHILGRGDPAHPADREFHGLGAGAVVPGAYLLEVCSPGVDRVLGRAIDFERNVGREVKLETSRPHGGRRRFRGELVGFEDRTAAVRIEDQAFHIPFELISQAKAFYPFETTGARK